MRSTSIASSRHLAGTPRPRLLDEFARRAVLRRLEALEEGCLALREAGREWLFGDRHSAPVTVVVEDPGFYSEIAFGGALGAADAYIRGYWRCETLTDLVRLLLRNRPVVDAMETGSARLTRPLQQLFQWVNRNTRAGARRNIAAHYDLGNDFFALWLDETMMYSSAVFPAQNASLFEAQRARLDLVCRKLDLQPTDHLLEIGTGWGGLAMHAAQHFGCQVTTTTVSRAQYELARRRIEAARLADRIEVLEQDYRDLTGRYDKLVSIEMIEAIGSRQYPLYFRRCSDLLKPGGRLLIQSITIADRYFAAAEREVDFIKRYIFPGSCIPSVSILVSRLSGVGDLLLTDLEDIGLHYARTLNHWRANFRRRLGEVRALGYSEEFIRMWEYYFCYCEGGFLERHLSDIHLVAEKAVRP
jgi:cyclopropane-fatty-acyl-phospholipid synthase